MDPKANEAAAKIQEMFGLHDQATASFRAELAQRSAGEVLYDDYLLAEMRKGKPFQTALRKANLQFPAEALNPDPDDLASMEEHYRFFLRMVTIDEDRRLIEVFRKALDEQKQRGMPPVASAAGEPSPQAPDCPPASR